MLHADRPIHERDKKHSDELTSVLNAAVADEMRQVRTVLENLAEMLCGDEYFVTHYLEQLQMFDLLIQCTDESALVLDRLAGGAPSYEAIAAVRLGAVRDRLHHALERAV